ncbi:BRCA1-associated RING domain protein 1 [Trichonephila inaurata madagascariensis]|uniref:BRCA1-associated RING domain protein 1 n=1 Tax=Trichonephila inaurata madagascariensis TaxID=2747483 RepID=A0A8X6KQD3_9ARAC|nr:BRCA1-associated RING domain protein 1 [Trichonephila inaurata madagascariensis]
MSSSEIWDAIKSLEDALKCNVCNYLLKDPLLIVKCGHTTCKLCFTKHTDMTCPVCKVPVNSRDSLEDKQLVELLAQLKCLQNLISSINKEEKVPESSHETRIKGNKKNEPSISTPKTPSVESQSKEKSFIQETPESQLAKTPVASSKRTRKSGSRKSSNSFSSLNTTVCSPSNINKKNHKGETPLQVAVIKGDIARVKELLKIGALVNTQDNNGWTPLHEASNRDFVEIAKVLLDHGALVNVPSLKDNVTPLHDALLNNLMDVAVLLASRGADLHAKTSFGYTALDLCKREADKNKLIEACSPFIQGNTIIPDSKPTKNDKLVILCSNIDEKQKEKLQKCAQMLKADIVDEFKSEVTHVITSCDNMGNCTRTMKILLGILTGKWVMNFQWIEVCLEYKQKVDEEVFEVQGTRNQSNTQGPKRGRKNYEQKCPPLFDGFFFYLHGTFAAPTPTREDLSNLIHLGGGKLLSREPKQDTIDSYMIPYHAAESPLEDTSHIILYQEKPPKERHIHSGHICTSQVMWLVTCISEFKILEPQQTNVNK